MAAVPTLSGAERQQQILRLLEREQRVTVARVCEQFVVSEATARRDLERLSEQGLLRRVHGGAIVMPKAPPELPIHQRSSEQADEKRQIGAAAAGMVADGQTIFLGSGTTVLEMARNLGEHRDLTVITNSLMVINALAVHKEMTLISLGGMFRPSELSFIGHITEQALAELRADKVFIGTRAIDVEEGLTNAYLPETMTDRTILRIAREVVVLADHTKCGRTSTAFLAPLSVVQYLVTDSKTSPEFVEALARQGPRVIVV